MGGHAVGHGLHRRLGVESDDGRLDEVGHVRADHDDAEQLAVPALVDGLHPADGLVLHHRAGIRRPREPAYRHVVAVPIPGFCLSQADAGDFGIGVDGARNGAGTDDGLVARCVLGGDLALAERRWASCQYPAQSPTA